MTDTTHQPTPYYACECCQEVGNDITRCEVSSEIRLAPNGWWHCEGCYDDYGDAEPGAPPPWADLPRALDLTAELAEARLAIAHMHDLIALPTQGQPLMICDGCGCTMTDEEVIAGRAAGRFLSCCPERKMRVATREDWDHWMKVSDEIEKELRDAAIFKSRAQAPAVKIRPTFPILGSNGARIDLQLVTDHGQQAQSNHYQSVDRLAERGGLSWCELYAVLHDQKFKKMDVNDAMIACRALEARYLAAVLGGAE